MRYLVAVLLSIPLSSFAGEPQLDPIELQGILSAVSQQRDGANNQVAQMAGKMNVMQAELEKLKKAAAECKPAEKK